MTITRFFAQRTSGMTKAVFSTSAKSFLQRAAFAASCPERFAPSSNQSLAAPNAAVD